MKRNNPPFPFEVPPSTDSGRRFPMNCAVRTILVLLLVLILVATGLAWYASAYPVVLTLNRQALAYSRVSSLNYTVNLKPETFGDSSSLPMGQVYIRDTVESLDLFFTYDLLADREVLWDTSYRIDAIVQVCDRSDPDVVYLQQSMPLLEKQEAADQASLAVVEESAIDLAEYEELASQFNPDPQLPVSYRLRVVLDITAASELAGGPHTVTDQLVMDIPLLEPSMIIERTLPSGDEVTVSQGINYQLALAPLPFFVYPATAGLTLVLLLLLLLVTRSRRRSRFQRRLKRRLRRVRRTLILIGNKAWEPEWCVRIINFKSLARTAKKLKLPVFCYIEKRLPVAYFYVQLGENNYCYIYSPDPAVDLSQLEMGGDESASDPDLDEDYIPVLPEDDDLDEELAALDNLDDSGNGYSLPARRIDAAGDAGKEQAPAPDDRSGKDSGPDFEDEAYADDESDEAVQPDPGTGTEADQDNDAGQDGEVRSDDDDKENDRADYDRRLF